MMASGKISHVATKSGAEWPVRVTSCRDDYIDLTSAVPRIAANLLHGACRRLWAICGIRTTTRPASSWRDHPIVIAKMMQGSGVRWIQVA
jgi:hypothetical protein